MKTAIENWDGKDVDVIQSIYDQFSNDEKFAARLLEYLPVLNLQRGSTWLIKRYLENKGVLSESQVYSLLSKSSIMQHWEAQLHVLQCLPFVKIPKKVSDIVYDFLKSAIKSDRKFVRAWCYGGLIELSEQHIEYRENCRKIVLKGYRSEGGSIGARIRQATKKRPYWIEVLS